MKSLEQLFDDICEIKDTHTYFTDDEIMEGKNLFFEDMKAGNKQLYIDMLQEEIEERRPVKYGCYDLKYERFIESVMEDIKNYKP